MSEAYFQKVRESVVLDVINAGKGQRNEVLNKAAFTLGRHAHMSPANLDSAIMDLHNAAKQIGLQASEIKPTVGSGFKRGGDNPKVLENDDAQPYTPSEMDRLVTRLASKELLAKDDETRADKIAKARAAWERAVPITPETIDAVRPALLYLNNRKLKAASAVNVARFSPNIYDGPAIMFPALNEAGEIEGIQSVLLTPEGRKREHNGISKYSRGVIAGNAMQIGSIHDGGAIVMVEGPEDALSVRQATMGRTECAIVCTFGKAGMSTFNVPRASDVTVCADPDLDIDNVADVLRGDGSTSVHVVRFDQLGAENVKDANDYLREAGADKLLEALAMAKPVEEVRQEEMRSEMNWPTLYEWIDPALIPARRWIYGNHYIRGNVSVLASAGGVGKTSMVSIEAISVATGRAMLGEQVKEQTNVWLINLEDPLEEMQRRIAAACMHYDVKPDDLRGRLFLDAGRDLKIMFAKQSSAGIETFDEIAEYMIKRINELNIGLVIIDPWVGANQINENDNVAMNAAVAVVRHVADKTYAAMCLVHHIRKTNGEDATIDSVRGAGSLIGAARAARIVNRVDKDDAMRLGVSEGEALGIFRVDDGKANLAPPAEKALYRRMVGVKLPNEEYVGVATQFKMPDMFDGIKAKDALDVQRAVGAACERGEAPRENVQAKGWVGFIAAQILDLDMDKPHEKARCKAIIKKWIETDVLRKEMMPSKRDGRDVPSVVVGTWITREEAGI